MATKVVTQSGAPSYPSPTETGLSPQDKLANRVDTFSKKIPPSLNIQALKNHLQDIKADPEMWTDPKHFELFKARFKIGVRNELSENPTFKESKNTIAILAMLAAIEVSPSAQAEMDRLVQEDPFQVIAELSEEPNPKEAIALATTQITTLHKKVVHMLITSLLTNFVPDGKAYNVYRANKIFKDVASFLKILDALLRQAQPYPDLKPAILQLQKALTQIQPFFKITADRFAPEMVQHFKQAADLGESLSPQETLTAHLLAILEESTQ
ncbi:hypothetical protein COB21_02965 [Candidatus Aerophobetes bacterium]|uniref:Uncharacterized protein n=1 Tax=Aerophobetes bacterium TaxID=2030807 RepID=A0A2A4X5S6_UNCAE|nr:MAG: hypothetical protein COB21_02965 [Candidatus Aerophobetes bacterium]